MGDEQRVSWQELLALSSEVFALDGEPNAASNAIGYAKHSSRSDDAVIRVFDEAGNVIEAQFPCGARINPMQRGSLWLFFRLFLSALSLVQSRSY